MSRAPTWEECYRAAQLVPLPDIGTITSEDIKKLVVNHANAIGCPQEYIFLPLLSFTAGLMGNKISIFVNQTWQEPPVLWTMVGAKPGTRKTSALKQLMKPLLEIQREQERTWTPTRSSLASEAPSGGPPKLLFGPPPLDEINSRVEKNGGKFMCIAENFELFLNKLSESNETHNICLSSLYDGLPTCLGSEVNVSVCDRSTFTITGMATPEFIADMHKREQNTIFSRFLISCPFHNAFPSLSVDDKFDFGTLSFKAIFQAVFSYHQQECQYSFSESARQELARYHNEEWRGIVLQLEQDEVRRGSVEKSLGHAVRLAGILKALANASEYCKNSLESTGNQASNSVWDLTIDDDTFRQALKLSKFFLEEKLALMKTHSDFVPRPISMYVGPVLNPERSQSPVLMAAPRPCSVENVFQNGDQLSPRAAVSVPSPATSTSDSKPETTTSVDIPAESSSEAWINSLVDKAEELKQNIEENLKHIKSAKFYQLDEQTFIQEYRENIRRLLEAPDDGTGVAAYTSSTRCYTPEVQGQTTNKPPAWASALFFKKVSSLGLGCACKVKSMINGKISWKFHRRRLTELEEKQLQLLMYLCVDTELYKKVGDNVAQDSIVIAPSSDSPVPVSLFPAAKRKSSSVPVSLFPVRLRADDISNSANDCIEIDLDEVVTPDYPDTNVL